ncbi:MAG: peptide-methionine (R)-S-oxide reductase [Bacteroidetes bacterium B1(2017)]|nr:MAG: peptide-methionine (R)-S-oxide reductase [Bacteroidetes bacterium B1(2017)]
MKRLLFLNLGILLLSAGFISCNAQNKTPTKSTTPPMVTNTQHKEISTDFSFDVQKSDSDWKKTLSPEQYAILREKGTERPFTSDLEANYDGGTYTCAACGNDLFSSEGKFDSGCGWPSFYEALDKTKIVTHTDTSHGMVRTEIMCAKCGGHLGHVFNDGPSDKTGLRYCVNGKSLNFQKK